MKLVVTDPIINDYIAFHKLILEDGIQKEFLNYRGQTVEETKKEIENWALNGRKLFPYFLRIIKLTQFSNVSEYNDTNSTLIGFISNTPAAPTDNTYSGFKTLMNFGLSKKYEGKGIMSMAMEMTMEKMYDLEYNIASALVQQSNIGSQKVLEKCGFDLIRDDIRGKTYVKALKVDIVEYRNSFGL